MAYHRGTGVKKSGPKGPRKAKGSVLEAIYSEIDGDPAQSSFSISDRVYERTKVRISASRIRAIRHSREKSASRTSYPMEARRPSRP